MTTKIVCGRGACKRVLQATAFLITEIMVLTGCTSHTGNGQKKAPMDSSATTAIRPGTDTVITSAAVHPSVEITKTGRDSLIVATVIAGSIPDSIPIQVDHTFQRIHIVLKEIRSDSLQASLQVPGRGRNLRINQIIMPDGTMDGPFGHDIRYRTGQKGDYTLIVGKDNMADGTVIGPVTIYLRLF